MVPKIAVGVGLILNKHGQVLIDRRIAHDSHGGLWEFPGGKIEADETPECCIRREIKEELALDIRVGEHLTTIDHAYENIRITMIAHICHYQGGEPQPLASDEIRWVTTLELDRYAFPEANQKLIKALCAWENGKKAS